MSVCCCLSHWQSVKYTVKSELDREFDAEIKKLVQQEYERRARLSALEMEAEDLYSKLMIEEMPVRCPRCKVQFNFDGDFSVTCGCGCGGCVYVYIV
jgi:hypothetical protein